MKNIVVLLLAALNVFLYSHPPAPAPVAPRQVAPPVVRVAARRLYFHSPLDAPAMSTSMNTSMGYFSPEETSEFRGGFTQAASTGSAGGSGPAGVSSTGNAPLNWNDPREAADIQAIQGVYQAAALR